MASDVSLLILDPATAAVVCQHWLGGRGTLAAALDVLARAPQAPRSGLECWSPVTSDEVRRITAAGYGDGATAEEVERLALRFPAGNYVWMLARDF